MLTIGMSVMAQKNISQNIEEKDGKLKIHVESSQDGKNEVFDRSYNVEGMSQEAKEKLINRITDSLWTASGEGNRKQIRIKVDRNGDNANPDSDDKDVPFSYNSPKGKSKRRVEIYKDGKKIDNDSDGNGSDDLSIFFKDFGKNMENNFDFFDHDSKKWISSLDPMMKDLKGKLKFDFKSDDMKDFDFLNESKTVKALKIYPNKPFDNKLNLKFYAPEKGDVSVIVMDINGKEVGSQKFKDFQGDFMGQVDLKKNVKGTVFVTVTQGEDGTAKRVVIE